MEINEIVSAIESLTLIQASELVKALEEKFGTRAAWAADQQEMLRRFRRRSGCRCRRRWRSGRCR